MSVRVCVTVVSARPNAVRACIDSLLAQSLPAQDYRILVVADYASPVFAHRQITWILNAPRSIAAKRNIGLRNAGAPIVAFTDDDCVAHADWLDNGLRYLDEHAEEVGVQGCIEVPPAQEDQPNYSETKRLSRPLYQTSNIFYRVDRLASLGGFDERFAFQREDVEMGFRLLSTGYRIGYCEQALVSHPVRHGEYWDLVKTAYRKRFDPLLARLYPALFQSNFGNILPGTFRLMLLLWAAYLVSGLLFCPVCSFLIPLTGSVALAVRRCSLRWPGADWFVATVVSYLIAPLVAGAVVAFGALRFRRAA